jgi:hypothetical protein
LSSATRFLREKGVDFGVLWTGTPAFYERAGWVLKDRGLLGESTNRLTRSCCSTVLCQPLVSVDVAWLERLRSNHLSMRAARKAIDYCAIPVPAVQVFCFFAQGDHGCEGFALVGEQDGSGFFYEMAAPQVLWEPIWTAVSERFDRLVVNGRLDDPFSQWLDHKGLVEWHPQNKSMWLSLSGRLNPDSFASWHIPYFDWI